MTDNEIKFVEFWEKYLKGKVSVQTKLITEAYFHLYGKIYQGPTCGRCIQTLGGDLKKIYQKLAPIYNEQKIKEMDSVKEIEVDTNKTEELNYEQLEIELLTEKQRKFAPHIKKGMITKKLNQMKKDGGEKEL